MAALRFIQIGSGSQDRDAACDQGIQDAPEVTARDWIDSIGRLVEQNDARRVNQRAHQAELLLHSPRKIPRQTLAKLSEAGRRQQFR